MKNNIKNVMKILLLSCITSLVTTSCEYKEVADAEYSDQILYMPGAKSGIYRVNEISQNNAPYRYRLDMENKKVIVPLGIYRAGVNNKGNVNVDIIIENQIVQEFIAGGELTDEESGLTSEILPQDKFSVPSSVQIKSGEEKATFDLAIDLQFLLDNLHKRYATAVKIINSNIKINEALSYLVIDFDTDFLIARPGFTYSSEKNGTTVTFTNTTAFGVNYKWDFGDGATSDEENPKPHTYPSLGAYNVKLSATSVTGEIIEYTSIVHLWEDITETYILNPGPFKRSDRPTGKVGILQDWSYTPNVLASNGKGGYYLENGGVMDFYSSSADLINAKIYQSLQLPQGAYKIAFTPYKFTGTNTCYLVVYKGSELPDINNIENNPDVLGNYLWNEDVGEIEQGVEFSLDSNQNITIGFVVSNQAKSRLQISAVNLYR